ncbi:hypothetical protein Zmor_018382 [Zophobas morio]|uniref:Ketosynthase family 3 (KS3) domain-containing protein n=1 Tax=Zophobas morio TaxID=2755281 RepID=A0AA38IC77_9CUCU|nr:hypothetical protein Zmor_018382 [Zophobas morio]
MVVGCPLRQPVKKWSYLECLVVSRNLIMSTSFGTTCSTKRRWLLKRWKINHPDLPKRSAHINNINKLDAGYFGLHYRQADNCDPVLKVLMETVIEAIMDAGVNPLELKGSKTGVFISFSNSDVENIAFTETTELLVGSVKSNIGHAEPVSGLCSIVKVLIAMETGFIPANFNLKTIRRGLKGIEHNRIKFVTEATELLKDDAIVGVNNFGFGGNNSHVILQRFKKHKIDFGLTKHEVLRLICVSGRSNEAVLKILGDVSNKNFDEEYIGLLHQLYKINHPNHLYRGHAVVSKRGVVSMTSKLLPSHRPHLHVFFGRFVINYRSLASYLKKCSIFEYIKTRYVKVLFAVPN